MSTELTPSMRRSVLISTLRDPATWPKGFAWHYNDCTRCASAVYRALYSPDIHSYYTVGNELGLSESQSRHVFNGQFAVHRHLVTAAMVANRLEQIHRELESAP